MGQKQDYNNFTYDPTKVHCPSEVRVRTPPMMDGQLIQMSIFMPIKSVYCSFFCLSVLQDHPFLFTKLNSLPSPPLPPTTDVPVDTPTTPPTVPADPVTKCSSPLPVWVPVVVAFASLLIGVVVSRLFFSFQQRLKKNNNNVELTSTGL